MLHSRLARSGIDLTLIFGREAQGTVPKTVPLDESWGCEVPNRYLHVGHSDLVWQKLPSLRGYDLVIVEHAARLLNNYHLMLGRKLGHLQSLAFWGHGGNFQAGASRPFTEALKCRMARMVDHWFAYTGMSEQRLLDIGLSSEHITVVNNTIDTSAISISCSKLSAVQLAETRAKLGIKGGHVGLYCGGLYAEKRIEFLLDAASKIRRRVPDFELIVIGDGPDAHRVREFSTKHEWVKYVGALRSPDTVPYYALSRCLLMPGLVGLVMVDAITLGVPLVTTDNSLHSPEIAYLRPWANGLMTKDDMEEYVDGVSRCLTDNKLHQELVAGCREDAPSLSLEFMVDKFEEGIRKCIQ